MIAGRFQFFGGKGGVGKTTLAAATAIAAAESRSGSRVLLVSTDPAHSLGDALELKLSARPRRVATRRGRLAAVELDADAALGRWLGERRATLREIVEQGTYLEGDEIDRFLGLSLPGVDELVGLVELERLAGRAYDEVVVDTAPTGHLLRLLAMPATLRTIARVLDGMRSKHHVLRASLGGTTRAEGADRLVEEIEERGVALEQLLRDPARCAFHWVTLPEGLALEETRDALAALRAEGFPLGSLVVNRLTPAPRGRCPGCERRIEAEHRALAEVRAESDGVVVRALRAEEVEPRGVARLREVAKRIGPPPRAGRAARRLDRSHRRAPVRTPYWVEQLGAPGMRLLVFAGKGGVGKSTCAATAALGLAGANPARRVLLLSTDPAHSLGDALGVPLDDRERRIPGAPPRLRARELDATRAFQGRRARYRDGVDQLFDALRGGSRFDASLDRAVARDLIDLAPPGLDELFAILSLLDALVAPRPRYDLVVVDAAPTGHALRLLGLPPAALEWVHAILAILLRYRQAFGLGELAADLIDVSRELRALIELLRDAQRAQVVAVTRPGALPRLETARLHVGLDALGIAAPLLLVNGLTTPGCPRCRRAADRERREIAALASKARCAMIGAPAVAPPPRGVAALREFGGEWRAIER